MNYSVIERVMALRTGAVFIVLANVDVAVSSVSVHGHTIRLSVLLWTL